MHMRIIMPIIMPVIAVLMVLPPFPNDVTSIKTPGRPVKGHNVF